MDTSINGFIEENKGLSTRDKIEQIINFFSEEQIEDYCRECYSAFPESHRPTVDQFTHPGNTAKIMYADDNFKDLISFFRAFVEEIKAFEILTDSQLSEELKVVMFFLTLLRLGHVVKNNPKIRNSLGVRLD